MHKSEKGISQYSYCSHNFWDILMKSLGTNACGAFHSAGSRWHLGYFYFPSNIICLRSYLCVCVQAICSAQAQERSLTLVIGHGDARDAFCTELSKLTSALDIRYTAFHLVTNVDGEQLNFMCEWRSCEKWIRVVYPACTLPELHCNVMKPRHLTI